MSFSVTPFLANVPILYPLKTPENLFFSGAFRGYQMGTLARNGLMKLETPNKLEHVTISSHSITKQINAQRQ